MSKSKVTSTSHAIDSMNDAAPPLDYSFRSVATFPGIVKVKQGLVPTARHYLPMTMRVRTLLRL